MSTTDMQELPIIARGFGDAARKNLRMYMKEYLEDYAKTLGLEKAEWYPRPGQMDSCELETYAPLGVYSVVFCNSSKCDEHKDRIKKWLLNWAWRNDASWVMCADVVGEGLVRFSRMVVIPWYFDAAIPSPLNAYIALIVGAKRESLATRGGPGGIENLKTELRELAKFVVSPKHGKLGSPAAEKITIQCADPLKSGRSEVEAALALLDDAFQDRNLRDKFKIIEGYASDSADKLTLHINDKAGPQSGALPNRRDKGASSSHDGHYWVNLCDPDGKQQVPSPFKIEGSVVYIRALEQDRPFWIAFLLLCLLRDS